MKKLNKIAIALTAVTCASAFAQSEPYNPSWYLAPSLNAIKPDSGFGVDKTGYGLGLRFGKPVSRDWDIQIGSTFARSRDNGMHYDQTTLGADWLFMFSRNHLRPFLLLGLGAEHDEVSGSGIDATKTSPYINGGLGLQYAFSDQWSTQADWRRVHGYLRDNNFGADKSNNDYLSVGLTYAFDKAPQKVVKAAPAPAVIPEPVVMAAPPEPVKAAAPPRFERYTLSATELFAFDSAVLRLPQPKLDEIASMLSANPAIDNVVVTGFADRLGSNKYNQKLSLRRAESVKLYLTDRSVGAGRITTDGKGEENPVVECKDTKWAVLVKCLEPNRRVEVAEISAERRVN